MLTLDNSLFKKVQFNVFTWTRESGEIKPKCIDYNAAGRCTEHSIKSTGYVVALMTLLIDFYLCYLILRCALRRNIVGSSKYKCM